MSKKLTVVGGLGVIAGLLAAGCATPVPGGTAASPILQRDVTRTIMLLDTAADPECKQRKLVNTEVVDVRSDGSSGTERWTVDRCGNLVSYRVAFSPGAQGGTDFSVRLEKTAETGGQDSSEPCKWQPRCSTPGVSLKLKEYSREKTESGTKVTYHVIAGGLPKDHVFTFWMTFPRGPVPLFTGFVADANGIPVCSEPGVKGKRGGWAVATFEEKSCRCELNVPWGSELKPQ